MLTAIQVRNPKPKNKTYQLNNGTKLFLHVAISDRKTWRYCFVLLPNKTLTFVRGAYPVLSLKTASK
ncbi:Arm DNA-binding domain-containing protein [Desulfobulbus oligotrophicus]|uniref:Arm DNA-binding domain-containing protein n=1 Tax=Desulfobulbus oligotrophicus TaxID=1909699 RepID=UPI0038CDB382